MTQIKEFLKYSDLYNTETILSMLKNKFNTVSFTIGGNTIAKMGSPCKDTKNINTKANFKIVKIIQHRKQEAVTILTNNKTYFTFINI